MVPVGPRTILFDHHYDLCTEHVDVAWDFGEVMENMYGIHLGGMNGRRGHTACIYMLILKC